MSKEVVVLPGDGIGPEVIKPTVELIRGLTDEVEFEEYLIGGASIDEYGVPLTDETLRACQQADAVLLGAVGGPKWAYTDPEDYRTTPEAGLLALRREMGLYFNRRPIIPHPALYDRSPLKNDRIQGAAIQIVRELTGGIYFGKKNRTQHEARDECYYSREEIERIAKVTFEAVKGGFGRKVTSVDKANVLETSKLWREVVTELGKDYDIELEHMYVDNAVMQLIDRPTQFDVILTENMFGDILSDAGATITGALGALPSLSLGNAGACLAEPVHGSAPDIAGQGRANPIGAFKSACMMLRNLLLTPEAEAIEKAVDRAIYDGVVTEDLGGNATTDQVLNGVLKYL